MKKKSHKKFLILLIIVLISLFVTLFFIINKKSEYSDSKNDESITENCQEFFDAYCALNSEKAGQMLAGLGEPMKYNDMSELLAQSINYEIIEITEETEDSAIVKVKIENIDIAKVLELVTEDFESVDDAQKYLTEAFSEEEVPRKTFDVKFRMINDNGIWKVEMNGDLSDALLGGIYSLIDSALKEGTE